MAPSKKQESLPLHQETKQESASGKKKVSSKKQKTENGKLCSCVFYKYSLERSTLGQGLESPRVLCNSQPEVHLASGNADTSPGFSWTLWLCGALTDGQGMSLSQGGLSKLKKDKAFISVLY